MRACRAARDAADQPACVRIPVRRAEPGERGDEDDAVGRVHRACERLALGGVRDQAEPVAQPLQRRAGRRAPRPRARTGGLTESATAAAVSSSPWTAAPGEVPTFASTKLARAVGRLRLRRASSPDRRAPPADRRRSRRSGPSRRAARLGHDPRRRDDLAAAARARRRRARAAPSSHSSVSRRSEQRARRIGHIRHVRATAGQLPDQPRVDGAEGETVLAAAGRCAESTRAWSPRSTGRARARSPRGSARPAARGSARPCGGPARRSRGATGRPLAPLPDDRRLALVRDPDRAQVGGGHAARRVAPPRPLRGRSPRSPPGRARPTPAAGSAAAAPVAAPAPRSSSSTTRHVVPEVPWSIARITGSLAF